MPRLVDMPQRVPPRRRWRLIVILIIVAFIGTRTALSYYVDVLWFGSLGYGDVFWKTRSLRWVVCAAFTAATFIILYGSFLALKRASLADLRDLVMDATDLSIGQELVRGVVRP